MQDPIRPGGPPGAYPRYGLRPGPRFRGPAPLRFVVALALPFAAGSGFGATEARAQLPTVAPESSEAAVIRMAEAFIRALSAKDTGTLASLLSPLATLHSVRVGPEGPEIRMSTREEFLAGLGGDERELLERIWDPVAMVAGSVAMVLAPYDFFVDGRFSHCGTDIFTFLKGSEGWTITGATYDVVREECPPSPLGPPWDRGGLTPGQAGG